MRYFIALSLMLCGFEFAQGAGTVADPSRAYKAYNKGSISKNVELVTIAWTADAANGSLPTKSIQLCGFLMKVITNPGATAPTDNYDIAFGDPADTALDAFAAALANRDTANTEVAYPVGASATAPVFLCGSYLMAITNNSVNSATGSIVIYLID